MTAWLIDAAYLLVLFARARLAHRAADKEARQAARAGPSARGTIAYADVAVLQPILAGDPALPEVLAEALDALPKAAHVMWLVDEDDPRAVAITTSLMDARSERRITRLLCPPPTPGTNPKTVKLAAGVMACDEPVLVVLDDDARLGSDALDTLLGALDHGALATALPWYDDSPSLPGALLAHFVNDHAALTYLAPLALLPPVSINGMAYALRRETLDTIGGFGPLAAHLTDDLALALSLRAHALPIVQTSAPVRMRTSLADQGSYVRLMHRWYLFATLLLAAHGPRVRVLAALLQGLPPLLLWGALGATSFAASPAAFAGLAATLVLRQRVLGGLHRRFVPGALRHRPFLSALVELLQPLHLLHALLVRDIHWRTRRYRVRAVDDFGVR